MLCFIERYGSLWFGCMSDYAYMWMRRRVHEHSVSLLVLVFHAFLLARTCNNRLQLTAMHCVWSDGLCVLLLFFLVADSFFERQAEHVTRHFWLLFRKPNTKRTVRLADFDGFEIASNLLVWLWKAQNTRISYASHLCVRHAVLRRFLFPNRSWHPFKYDSHILRTMTLVPIIRFPCTWLVFEQTVVAQHFDTWVMLISF